MNHHALLIAFEGLDCSFKETNSKRLYNYLKEKNDNVYFFSFPNYDSGSSYFVKEFLNGNYKVDTFNPQYYEIISDMFTLDRYDTYKKKIEKLYENEKNIIIVDRWCKSNLYNAFRTESLSAVYDLLCNEHITYDLPIEDVLIYMNMPYKLGREIRMQKNNLDINEKNEALLSSLGKQYLDLLNFNAKSLEKGAFNRFFNDIKIVDCGIEDKDIIFSEDEIFYRVLDSLKSYIGE